jgi:FkbH-like protein
MQLEWLAPQPEWNVLFEKAQRALPAEQTLASFVELAASRIDFIQTARLDRAVQRWRAHSAPTQPPNGCSLRVALLGSSTLTHLIPGIRIGGLRRGIWVDVYEGPYGMYRQELQDPSSGLHAFRPDVLLLSLDSQHLLGADGSTVTGSLQGIHACWQLAQQTLGCAVVQQTVLPVFLPLLGNNEHRYDQSRLSMAWALNQELRRSASEQGVHLLSVDTLSATDGITQWYDEALWHGSKQEIHPRVAHIYGDHLGRILSALRGRSAKCLVLDLDNTLWGGVIGDDGLSGIKLGQGSALGEAYVAFQRYVRELSRRGVILAVCSKNDEANALEAFDRHPEMVLRRKDIACFMANWEDKATNLRAIAKALNIGLDSLVFVDDNPFERNLVRRELPEVAVPELPEDPSRYAACIANAGYFESLSMTAEDLQRSAQYQMNAEREHLRESATDMESYLRDLKMELLWAQVDPISLPRVVQLINKTNQFNLTTQRYTEQEVSAMMSDSKWLVLQFRLLDRYGDNGIISVVIGQIKDDTLLLETWLMSCRVLGRQVETATLNIVADMAERMGAERLLGIYRPTLKNGMVREHYEKLGFELVHKTADGLSQWKLDLARFAAVETNLQIIEGTNEYRRDLQSTH